MNYRSILTAAALCAAALRAQPPAVVHEPAHDIHFAAGAMAKIIPDTINFVHVQMGFEMADVKGLPFAADFVTESTQTLADGNRIKSSSTTSYARDGEGRSRREVSLPGMEGATENKSIVIHDPVAKVDYVLEVQNKIARKVIVGDAAKITTFNGGNVMFNRREGRPAGGPEEGTQEVVMYKAGVPEEKMNVLKSAARAKMEAEVQHRAGGVPALAPNANVKTDQLGKRLIEGVEAEGTRNTFTIPAGLIGNERAIDIVSEHWYSNELKTMVLTTRSDPRTGETNYKIANLRRGEPSRGLFEVPSGYTLKEETAGFETMRTIKDRAEKK